jgi:hypothetical protein
MANKITDTKYYSAIADAIRAKNGSSDTYYPADMAQAIEDIPSGGMDPDLEALMRGDASGDIEITLPTNSYAACFYIDSRWMQNSGVRSLTVKGVENFGNINLNNGGLVMGPAQIEELHLPNAKKAMIARRSSTIYPFQHLSVFDAPEITQIGQVNSYMFYGSQLTELVCPECLQFGSYMFSGSTSLELVDVNGSYISGNVFNGCSSLKALVLRRASVGTLDNANALTGTLIESGTGYIYVPDNLKASYQAATNWSTFSAQFRSLENYTDDGTVNGKFIMPQN